MARRILLAALVGLSGCTGGGDDDEPIYELTSGTYVLSDIDVQNDGCEVDPVENLSAQTVAVSGDSVTIGPVELVRDGNALEGSGQAPLDMDPADCILTYQGTAEGRVSGTDAFDLDYEILLTESSGTECGDLTFQVPCATHFSYHAEK